MSIVELLFKEGCKYGNALQVAALFGRTRIIELLLLPSKRRLLKAYEHRQAAFQEWSQRYQPGIAREYL